MSAKKQKQAWPTQAAMQQIYDLNLWGGRVGDYYSGDGSHQKKFVVPYIKAVTSFLTSFESPLVLCDLGCGDFNVGKELVKYTQKYIAIDIVPSLILRNQTKFQADNLSFQCLDIAKDKLPKADCAIVRQVLQHLSNVEVQRVVGKLRDFKYVILTEHIPLGDFEPNVDIISGQGIRLKKNSGIDLLTFPFSLKTKSQKELLSIVLDDDKGKIVTTLYETVIDNNKADTRF